MRKYINLTIKILSRLVLLVLGLVFLLDFFGNGWSGTSLTETYRFTDMKAGSELGLYTFLILRALGIIAFSAFIFLYLLPSIFGFIRFIKMNERGHKIFIAILGVSLALLLGYFFIAHVPGESDTTMGKYSIAVGLLAIYLYGLLLAYKGRNLFLIDFGFQKRKRRR